MTRSSTSNTQAALLVVDLQRGMFNGERLPPIHAGEALLARVRALIAQARGTGVPVVFVRHGGGPGHLLGASGHRVVDDEQRLHGIEDSRATVLLS